MKKKLLIILLLISTVLLVNYSTESSTLFDKLSDNMSTNKIQTITVTIPFGTPNDTYVFNDVNSVNFLIDSLKETIIYNTFSNNVFESKSYPNENEPHLIFFNRVDNHSLYSISFKDRSTVKVGSKYYHIRNNILFDKIQILIEQKNSF